ncbi:MAG: DUF1361 domain-containing protein [Caldilineae bacterium]|nr:MAG: DUF1361 domain-containing protein [Caldilineae bacterium]
MRAAVPPPGRGRTGPILDMVVMVVFHGAMAERKARVVQPRATWSIIPFAPDRRPGRVDAGCVSKLGQLAGGAPAKAAATANRTAARRFSLPDLAAATWLPPALPQKLQSRPPVSLADTADAGTLPRSPRVEAGFNHLECTPSIVAIIDTLPDLCKIRRDCIPTVEVAMSRRALSFWTILRLLAASCVPVLLLVARIVYTGRFSYAFLLWNLFLAWLPPLFAFLSLRLGFKRRLAGLWALAWLLFFPNAPYIVTDLIHLPYGRDISVLYDVVMLFSFAICGIVLGFVSLRWMQLAMAERIGIWWSRVFVVVILGLSGFGIYVGRILRWNSWDVLTDPLSMARDLLPHFLYPLAYWRAWAVSSLFALLLIFLYWLFVVLPQMGMEMQSWREDAGK